MATFMQTAMGYVDNPDATSNCGYCMYRKGYEYLYGLNIKHYFVGWEGILITMWVGWGIASTFLIGQALLLFLVRACVPSSEAPEQSYQDSLVGLDKYYARPSRIMAALGCDQIGADPSY